MFFQRNCCCGFELTKRSRNNLHEEPTDESASLPLRKSRRVSNASNLRFKRGECVCTCSMIDCGITQAVAVRDPFGVGTMFDFIENKTQNSNKEDT